MRGRKSTFDEERFGVFLKAVGKGRTLTEATADAGIPRRTVHRWLANDPVLKKRVFMAKAGEV